MIEEEIRRLLRAGHRPSELIRRGFKRSTVYKVYKQLMAFQTQPLTHVDTPIVVSVTEVVPDRLLPGAYLRVVFRVSSRAATDIYLVRVGVQPEWLEKKEEWVAREVRDLLRPYETRTFSVDIAVPEIPFGAYGLRAGAEYQVLGQAFSLQCTWSPEETVSVMYPFQGVRIFVSHSTKDLALARTLRFLLDCYGIEAYITEEEPEPGAYLPEKLQRAIQNSNCVVVLWTLNAARSVWVAWEIERALEMGKLVIPLLQREAGPPENLRNIEWIEFDLQDPQTLVGACIKIYEKVESLVQQTGLVAAAAFSIPLILLGAYATLAAASKPK